MAGERSSSEYAMLPAGTIVLWGMPGETKEDFRPLENCKSVGKMGQTGGFVDCTALIHKNKQSISDLPDGPEKTFGFIDDPKNESFSDFLTAADKRLAVQVYVELPNGRTSTSLIALSGWEVNEVTAPASEVIQISVTGKQNDIKWGTTASSGSGDSGS